MSTRHITEFGLNMYVDGCALLQDDSLEQLDTILAPDAPEFHIYTICSRPRVALDPSRFEFLQDTFKGVFVVQKERSFEEFPFEWPYPPQGRFDRVESDWPHTAFQMMRGNQRVISGKAAVLAAMAPGLRDRLDLEVLYVGQSFGSGGERQAPERLLAHSTLQRILGEASRLQPDKEIWLALLHFEEAMITSIDGRIAASDKALADDDDRIHRILTQEVSHQQKINFIEAALIRHFEPKYNKTFRNTFPNPAHKTYNECYALDLNMVSVEFSSEPLHARLYSKAQAAEWIHFAMYPLHDPTQRKYMLDLLQPDEATAPHVLPSA